MNRTTVAVLYGGRSPEHSVSCVSAGAVLAHLDPDRYEVVPVGITRTGTWVLGDGDAAALAIDGRRMPEVPETGEAVCVGIDSGDRGVLRYARGERAGQVAARVDVVLPLLHGPFGEDGTVQGMLDLSGVPYVGPGVFASAAGMDKEFTKVVLEAAGLPIGPHVVLRPGTATLDDADRERLGLPVFVKPARGGSSIGITRVSRWEDLDGALDVARAHDDKVIVEAGIVGREVECGVLEFPDGRVEASPLAELTLAATPPLGSDSPEAGAGDAFYDFDTKYLDDTTQVDLPARIPDEVADEVRALAVRAFRGLDAKGLSRVDFFVTDSGPVLNEVNTLPGFTPISMYPQMWQAAGLDYPSLLATLLETALAR